MRFTLVDRIVELQPGVKIVAVKALTMAEEYLADHFPRFPVMPGVLMLEAMTHASAWLVRATDQFAHSMVVLKEARNIKYADFVAPGQVLTVTAEIVKHGPRDTQLKVQGVMSDRIAVSGRITLERFNLVDRSPLLASSDDLLVTDLRKQFTVLYQPVAAASSADEVCAAVAPSSPVEG